MTRALAACALAGALLLSGCANLMSVEQIDELAEAREACNDAGGLFVQWQSGWDLSERWRCDFDQREDR